ncbi:MAG: hypothetical protein IPI88_08390 [Chitinophagaceae bacterium]|nr:hypothetical protein [Chitinophagaceae bacterium]
MKEFFKKYKGSCFSYRTGIMPVLLFWNPLALAFKANLVLAIAALMISWWVLDAMPLAVGIGTHRFVSVAKHQYF